MARQGYDLQLTPTSATGTGWELHAVARDAAGGVEGAEDHYERSRTSGRETWMPKQSVLRLIKRWKRYEPPESYKSIPRRTRGLYVLYRRKKARDPKRMVYEVTYIGVAGLGPGGTGGIRGRLQRHFSMKRNLGRRGFDKAWTHYSMFEVHDNITREEIRELETLLLAIFKHDRRVGLTNKQKDSRKLISLRRQLQWKPN